MSADSNAIFSLYRSFRRQIRLFPTHYVRQFFLIKLDDDVRSIFDTERSDLQAKKLKRLEKELKNVTLANAGIASKFDHVLDLAYGRKGKLRWELMNTILSDTNAPIPDRIIPAVEKSRPPVYSPELAALLTSGLSHKTKPISHKKIKRPPTLPLRADPNSQEARLLGPFSKRREVNILWRYFTYQSKRVLPPLQVVLEEKDDSGKIRHRTDSTSLKSAGLRKIGLQSEGVVEEIEALTKPRSRAVLTAGSKHPYDSFSNSPLRPRFLRRRFAHLLGRLPILIYTNPRPRAETSRPASPPEKFEVALSPAARHPSLRFSPKYLSDAESVDVAWFDAAEADEQLQVENAQRLRAAKKAKRRLEDSTTGTEEEK